MWWEEIKESMSRPAQVYDVATGTFTLFSVSGGAIEILGLGGITTAAAVGATEVRLTANGVNLDAAAVAINGAVGLVFASCLNVAGTLVQAAAIPKTDALLHSKGVICGMQPAGPGLIVGVFSVGTSWTGEIWLRYRKLTANAKVTI